MISAIILTKNSSRTLKNALLSLKFCDEIIVVDDYSSDLSIKIAKKYKAKIFKRRLDSDFASQRNFGLEKAKGDWVLFIDSDEVVTPSLQKEIKQKVKQDKFDGFYIPRIDRWLGKTIKYGENNIKLLRLAKRKSGKWNRAVHEYWNVKGETGFLKNNIIHYPHPTLFDFVSSINKYSVIHSSQNLREEKKPSILKVVFFPVLKFKVNYIFKRGYKDGMQGFIIAAIMSFHSFLSWSDLWLTSKKK